MIRNSAFLVTVMVDDENLPNLGRRYELSPQGTTIGNSPESDIPARFLSETPFLFRIYVGAHGWHLLGLTEESLAYKNKLLIQDSQMYDGDVISIGPFAFEFCLGTGRKVRYFEQIENLLQEDFLTRAYNRSFLMNLLHLEIGRYHRYVIEAERSAENGSLPKHSLIFLDVDNFGMLNKQYGHHVGDEVLREMTKRIKAQLRATDIFARYGGEEFCVVLLDTSREQAFTVAENIRKLLAETPIQIEDKHSLLVTISGGIAELASGMSAESFTKAADENMRKAKKQGKNKMVG